MRIEPIGGSASSNNGLARRQSNYSRAVIRQKAAEHCDDNTAQRFALFANREWTSFFAADGALTQLLVYGYALSDRPRRYNPTIDIIV